MALEKPTLVRKVATIKISEVAATCDQNLCEKRKIEIEIEMTETEIEMTEIEREKERGRESEDQSKEDSPVASLTPSLIPRSICLILCFNNTQTSVEVAIG